MVEKKTLGKSAVNALFAVILTALALSCLLPLIYNLAVSFSSKAAAEAGRVAFWPVDFTANAYRDIMKEKNFFLSFLASSRKIILSATAFANCIS